MLNTRFSSVCQSHHCVLHQSYTPLANIKTSSLLPTNPLHTHTKWPDSSFVHDGAIKWCQRKEISRPLRAPFDPVIKVAGAEMHLKPLCASPWHAGLHSSVCYLDPYLLLLSGTGWGHSSGFLHGLDNNEQWGAAQWAIRPQPCPVFRRGLLPLNDFHSPHTKPSCPAYPPLMLWERAGMELSCVAP